MNSNDDLDYDQIAMALDRYQERADEIRTTLNHFYTIHENYSKLYQRLQTLQDKIRPTTFIPFSPHAFIPGQISNTNQLTVYLGEGFYREMSIQDTIVLVEKRLTGVQNEILLNHRELSTFGHHISHCYSIMGKPLKAASRTDQMKDKITGKQTTHNPTVTMTNPNRTNSNQPHRVTVTQQGVNEDGDGIFEITEYLDDDYDDVDGSNTLNKSTSKQTSHLDDIDLGPDSSVSDVFYESLTKTLLSFEKERLQDYSNEELDELESLERELMGDKYVPPKSSSSTTSTKSSTTATSTTSKPTKQVQHNQEQLEPRDTELLVDDIVIPTSQTQINKDQFSAQNFRREIGIESTSSTKHKMIEVVDETNDNDTAKNEVDDYFAMLAKAQAKPSQPVEYGPSPPQQHLHKHKEVEEPPVTAKSLKNLLPKQAHVVQQTDSLIKDTIQVRQRPQRNPNTQQSTPTPTPKPSLATPTQQPTSDVTTKPTETTTTTHQISQSGAIQSDSSQPSAAEMYQRYLLSIGHAESNNIFSQFLLDQDEDDGFFEDIDDLGSEYDDFNYDEDDDDDEDNNDPFYSRVQNIYANILKSDKEHQNQSNIITQPQQGQASKTIPNSHTDGGDDDENSEYAKMFWNHIETVAEQEQQVNIKKAQSTTSSTTTTSDSALPPQDRPIYTSFNLGTLRDGSHALLPRSNESTLYTSELIDAKHETSKTTSATTSTTSTGVTNQNTPQLPTSQPKVSRFKQMRKGLHDQ